MTYEAVREFDFSENDFRRVKDLIKVRAGIDLGSNKQSLVYGRLARRIRALGLASFSEYLASIEDEGSDEARRFVNAITTNVTEFFRENHHFDFLARTVLPALWSRFEHAGKRVRFWSAGCSSGEEPYSLAMVVRENMPASPGWDIKILATDLDTDVLAHASAGVYVADRIDKIGPVRLGRFFEPVDGGATYQARETIRSLITFKQLNLMEPWPMQGPFDLIFCRNVVIYFDEPTKVKLIGRYRELLRPDGHLFLGHSESIASAAFGLTSCGKTIHRRLPATAASTT
jgi:chemotaxis protein methyltransferase CheR